MSSIRSLLQRAAHVAQCLSAHAGAIDSEGQFPTEEFEWLREAGLLVAPAPPEQGGMGLGITPSTTVALLQTLWHIGYGNLAVGRLYEGHVNALQLVQWFGTPEQQERLFTDAREGKIFAVWNTQAGDGVRFERSEENWTMQGAKTFCSGAGHVLRPIVTGESDAGWQMAVVPMERVETCIDDSWWQPLGMRASASFKTDFLGAVIDSDDLLGEAGDYYRQPYFSGGAIRFCAVQLGGAAALFDATRRFLKETGRTDDVFQQARIGRMATKVESGFGWLQRAGEVWDAQPDAKTMVAFAAMTRLATEEIGLDVMQMAEQSVGARGLLRPHPFERMVRDLTIYLKQPHLDEIPGRVGKYALESEVRCDELWN
jgi:alkylation response protein AidB-like acyl-CoA dehydrogenase